MSKLLSLCIFALSLIIFPLSSLAAEGANATATNATSTTYPDGTPTQPKVKLETNLGDIIILLNPQHAPLSTKNFLAYVNNEFYNGTIFHRVINGFMIQGGGFNADMTQKTSLISPIKNEADNGLSNDKYTIAMARTGNPHSATAQFFINVADNPGLDHQAKTPEGWGYAVFGKVIEGQNVVDKIKAVPTGDKAGHQNVPTQGVIITRAMLLP